MSARVGVALLALATACCAADDNVTVSLVVVAVVVAGIEAVVAGVSVVFCEEETDVIAALAPLPITEMSILDPR